SSWTTSGPRSRRRWASMSTGSSPSAFAEFADVTLRLPDSLREYLRWPMGALVQGPSILPTIGRANPVVTVGDFCTLDLVARGRPVRHAVSGRRGRPRGRDGEIEGPRRLAADGTITDATRGPPEEGESAPEAGRGHVQGDAQGGADADAGCAAGLPGEGTQGDEGHRRDRLPGVYVRPI